MWRSSPTCIAIGANYLSPAPSHFVALFNVEECLFCYCCHQSVFYFPVSSIASKLRVVFLRK